VIISTKVRMTKVNGFNPFCENIKTVNGNAPFLNRFLNRFGVFERICSVLSKGIKPNNDTARMSKFKIYGRQSETVAHVPKN